MTPRITITFVICLTSCLPNERNNGSAKFNDDAKEFFIKNASSLDLSVLTEEEKCVLSKSIENDLDDLNDWKMALVKDNLVVRRYVEPYTNLNFSFVRDKSLNKLYFASFLDYWSIIFTPERKYYEKRNDTLLVFVDELKILRLNAPTFDTLLKSKEFQVDPNNPRDFYIKANFASRFLGELDQGLLHNKCSLDDLYGYAEKSLGAGHMKKDLSVQIQRLVRKGLDTGAYLVETHYFDFAGYLLVLYSKDGYSKHRTNDQLKVEFFWVPFPQRRVVGWGFDRPTEYYECFRSQ